MLIQFLNKKIILIQLFQCQSHLNAFWIFLKKNYKLVGDYFIDLSSFPIGSSTHKLGLEGHLLQLLSHALI